MRDPVKPLRIIYHGKSVSIIWDYEIALPRRLRSGYYPELNEVEKEIELWANQTRSKWTSRTVATWGHYFGVFEYLPNYLAPSLVEILARRFYSGAKQKFENVTESIA